MAVKPIINEEVVNLGRQKSIDFIKAFAILFMVTIHVLEEMSVFIDYGTSTVLKSILEFLGGPLAAPVFMFSMGIGIVYSKHRSPKQLFIRGLKILLMYFALNVLRFSLTYYIVGKAAGYYDKETFLLYAFGGDILAFCGITFIFTSILKKLRFPVWAMPLLAIFMQAAGSFINYESNTLFGRYVLIHFVNSGSLSYFPFLNWFIYPTVGILTAKYLRHIDDMNHYHRISVGVSSVILICVTACSLRYGISPKDYFSIEGGTYYMQTFFATLFCLSSVFIFEGICYFVFRNADCEKLNNLVYYMSNNLNTIYLLQWIIIGNVGVLLFRSGVLNPLQTWMVIPVGVLVTAISAYLAQYLNKVLKV